ncbi:MAG: DUF167 domain-containing protein [Dehalococcoidia bacterium]
MKRINVKVTPNAKKNEVTMEDDGLKVRVSAPAAGGRANKAVIEVLAKYFEVRKSDIRIARGKKSREKLIEIEDNSSPL